MDSKKVYHLGLSSDQLCGAEVALLPGDPDRVPILAGYLESPRELGQHREYRSFLAEVAGRKVIVCSTGIGGPSTCIAVEELAQLGVRQFIRVGTTGGIQPYTRVGHLIISQAAVRLDGASHHFAPAVYPAVADFQICGAIRQACEQHELTYHMGITASSDTFYPGQERYDTFSGHVMQNLRGSMEEWVRLGVLNFEMEAASLYTMCSTMGLRAGCVAGVIAQRSSSEEVATDALRDVERSLARVIPTALEALMAS